MSTLLDRSGTSSPEPCGTWESPRLVLESRQEPSAGGLCHIQTPGSFLTTVATRPTISHLHKYPKGSIVAAATRNTVISHRRRLLALPAEEVDEVLSYPDKVVALWEHVAASCCPGSGRLPYHEASGHQPSRLPPRRQQECCAAQRTGVGVDHLPFTGPSGTSPTISGCSSRTRTRTLPSCSITYLPSMPGSHPSPMS